MTTATIPCADAVAPFDALDQTAPVAPVASGAASIPVDTLRCLREEGVPSLWKK